MRLILETFSACETRVLGQKIGAFMPSDTVIAARGGLGMGKTVFAQGLALGLGISVPVVSPTYIYIQEYPGRFPFCHIDAYRMEQLEEEEIEQLGINDCFLSGKTAYVEWPEFIYPFLPKDAIQLQFSALPEQPDTRQLLFCFGEEEQSWLKAALGEPS
ncbi:MAG: tRNA (adenosine(37)-N6)-threonylcarbamoyltransferase complex ATPase subunit type 1 TsaE [Clostridiales bacterium]|nr:tRNA (adenosine(37)-N6)-threonylcarbamoyltransferase complex ATPase subunit type 1 TsaE [Clostridiales bacterium]